MTWIVGTDEAGYGPNLGPLVISASVWRLPPALAAEDLDEALAGCVARCGGARRGARVPIADSKLLYQPARGLGDLERGLWSCWAQIDVCPRTAAELWNALAPQCWRRAAADPWHDGFALALPTRLADDEAARLASCLRAGLAAAGVQFFGLRSRAVFPAEFNRLVRRWDSKGALLSRLTIELAQRAIAETADATAAHTAGADTPAAASEPIVVLCDKHGGRNHYGSLLAEVFDVALIETVEEGAAQSAYRFVRWGRPLNFAFTAGGESSLPVALASMASKYLREIAMSAFNRYWCDRVPGLRPTAGYPVDARRFCEEIARAQSALAIAEEDVWRSR